jgi:hypothetical protein
MSLVIVRAVARAEANDELHLGRLLILLSALGGKSRKSVDGIMKLAKLDFLLRYPNCLERALAAMGREPTSALVQEHERTSIESKMIRFRYGPWDGRYRRWISMLFARGLVTTSVEKRTVQISLTVRGAQIADLLSAQPSFLVQERRAHLLRDAFGGLSGTKLKDFIYKTFPEIIDMKWGKEIEL